MSRAIWPKVLMGSSRRNHTWRIVAPAYINAPAATGRTMVLAGTCNRMSMPTLSLSRWMSASVPNVETEEAEVAIEDGTRLDIDLKRNNRAKRTKDSVSVRNRLDKVVDKIGRSLREKDRVSSFDMAEAVDKYMKVGQCSSSMALLILKGFGSAMVDETPQERQRLCMDWWAKLGQLGTKLDNSHYNAMLHNFVVNGHDIEPQEWLSQMEQAGVKANRVTHQLLIAKYANEGNLVGATQVLEHMKQSKFPINEGVLHSLILCQALNGDVEAAKETMRTMESSGLLMGCDTYLALATGMVRGGCDFEKVNAELDEMDKQEIKIDDEWCFKIMLELVKLGKVDEARELLKRRPFKRGSFQAKRNYIPQFILNGAPELGLELFFEEQQKDSSEFDSDRADQKGTYVIRALIKADVPFENMTGILKKMLESKTAPYCVQKSLESCVLENKLELGSQIRTWAEEELDFQVNRNDYRNFVYLEILKKETPEELQKFLITLDKVGITVMEFMISELILPRLVTKTTNIMDALSYCRMTSNWTTLVNEGIRYFLNLATVDDQNEALSFMLGMDLPLRPSKWKQSLARNYMATDDKDGLVTAFFAATILHENELEHLQRREVEVYSSLMYLAANTWEHAGTKEAAEAKVKDILSEMKRVRIGMPDRVARPLSTSLECPECKELLEELVEIHGGHAAYWTQERKEAFAQERKALHRSKKVRSARSGLHPYMGEDEIPDGIDDMMKMMDKFEQKGIVSKSLFGKLTKALMDEGRRDDCLTVLERAAKSDYEPRFDILEEIVKSYIAEDRSGEAEEYVKRLLDSGARVFSSTIVTVCANMAKRGKFEEVLSFVAGIKKDQVVGSHLLDLCSVYQDEFGQERSDELMAAFRDSGLLGSSTAQDLAPLITAHLDKKEFEKAVEVFERFAKDDKKLPAKFRLMSVLIQEEDMDKIQRVLDASISVVGEDRSLYDFAHNFLDLGKTAQAKKLLETPGLRYHHDRVTYIMGQLRKNNKLKAMEDFVKLTRGLFACDRNAMYSLLLDAYVDDADKVTEVWEDIQEEGHAPSNRIRQKIANTLIKAGREVPFEYSNPRHNRKKQPLEEGQDDQ